MSTTKAVIFDMDGVIIDSEPLWQEAEILVFEKHGYAFTVAMCEETKGMRVDEVTVYWKNKLGADFDPKIVKEEIIETIIQLINQKGEAMEGLLELISQLKTERYKIALASSSTMKIIQAVLAKLELQNTFDFVHSAEYEEYGKPHPQVFITAAKNLHVDPSNCMVIEDSFFGVIAAIAAKMKVIGLPPKDESRLDRFVICHFIAKNHLEIAKNKAYK